MKISDLKGYKVVNPAISAGASSAPPDNRSLLNKASDFITNNNLPGAQLGSALGESIHGIIDSIRTGSFQPLMQAGAVNNANYGKIVGDTARSVALPASFGLAAPETILGAAGQYGGLGAVQAGGESLARGNTAGQAIKDTALGGAVGAGTGAAFGLLGKGINAIAKKAGPTALSFTSGVPKQAIEQARINPEMAKKGVGMSLDEIHNVATQQLSGLRNDLQSEFKNGLQQIVEKTPQAQTEGLGVKLFQNATKNSAKYGVSVKAGVPNFSKSAIVSPAEKSAVSEAFDTIKNWEDYSAGGIQHLSERLGALSKFDANGTTRSSAIVKSMYRAIGSSIKEHYPDLGSLKKNYSTNRKTLDEIQNVLNATSEKPTQIQGAVSRLDSLFKENKETYLNVIKQLSERSGVDVLSLLAGNEFQKVLPGFIRGIGGGSALAVGSAAVNPWLVLLAPLFSPRAVGAITRNAPDVATGASKLVRGITSQTIQQSIPQSEQSQP